MRSGLRTIFVVIIAALFAASASSRAATPSTQPVILPTTQSLRDLHDHDVLPLKLGAAQRAVVLLFISSDCPISNSYAPAFGELCRKFSSEQIRFFTVYVDSELKREAALAHHDQYAFPCEALLDPQQQLAHIAAATCTPDAVVVGADGLVLYRGRIDDLYTAVGRKRFAATTHELADVLGEIAADQPVDVPWKPAIGCAIP